MSWGLTQTRSKLGLVAGTAIGLLIALWLAPTGTAFGATPKITEFSAGVPGGAGLQGITTGPDGRIWFTGTGLLGRISVDGGVKTFSSGSITGASYAIAPGPDGQVFHTRYDRNTVGSLDFGGSGSMLTVPTANSGPFGLTQDSFNRDAMYFTELPTNKIGRVTDGVFQEKGLAPNTRPTSLAYGSDGFMWFTEYGLDNSTTTGNKIGRLDQSIFDYQEFAFSGDPGPARITAGQDGRMFFSAYDQGRIYGLTATNSPTPTSYTSGISANAGPLSLVNGPDGGIWFVEEKLGKVARLDPVSGKTTEYPLAGGAASHPQTIALGPDGNLWFTENGSNKIGRITTTLDAPTASNDSAIVINNGGTATPYPAKLNVAGLQGKVTDVSVRIRGIEATDASGLQFLLVGPGGQHVMLMDDSNNFSRPVLHGTTLNFSDSAPNPVPSSAALPSGNYRPTDPFTTNDTLDPPAPAPPHATALSAFDGTDPNGQWRLFVNVNDSSFELPPSDIYGGWAVNIKTTGAPAPAHTGRRAAALRKCKHKKKKKARKACQRKAKRLPL